MGLIEDLDDLTTDENEKKIKNDKDNNNKEKISPKLKNNNIKNEQNNSK